MLLTDLEEATFSPFSLIFADISGISSIFFRDTNCNCNSCGLLDNLGALICYVSFVHIVAGCVEAE